jgi:Tfp pilus assembly PilM family ATPase
MNDSIFFRLFPPPEFLMMHCVGLDISDDAVHYLSYKNPISDKTVAHFRAADLPSGLLNGGDTTDPEKLRNELVAFKEKAGLHFVKVSIPEEKAYLFQTEVPSTGIESIRQNIESKLEDSAPLAPQDAIFHFDLLPPAVPGGNLRASVSVVPRTYIEKMLNLLHSAGLYPLAFEVVPRSLARILVPPHSGKTIMVVHILNRKIGVYVVSSGTVSFTSTVDRDTISKSDAPRTSVEDTIAKEVIRIYEYWISRHDTVAIHDVVLVGAGADAYEEAVKSALASFSLNVFVPDIWANINGHHKGAKGHHREVPPISKKESLSYAVAAGLAILN